MNENNINNIELEKNKVKKPEETVKYISFSEKDENGKFREAYGYFSPSNTGKTFEQELQEIASKLKKR